MMERVYKARFDNGSPKPFTVDLILREGFIHLSWKDDEGRIRTENWAIGSITEMKMSSAIIELRYGSGQPYRQLEITDKDFAAEYRRLTGRQKSGSMFRSTGAVVLTVFAVIVFGLIACYVWVLPALADLAAKRFPKEYEIGLGAKMYKQVLQGSVIDSARTTAINHFFRQLHVDGEYPVRITVVANEVPNAYALPGGGIVVHSKILEAMKTSGELSGLLAHEYSHIQLRHSTRNIFRNLAGYLFVSVILGDFNSMTGIVLQHTENLQTLSYSRALEHEADENGLHILQNNKLDAEGMKVLFGRLKELNGAEGMEMLSTHPDMDARIAFVDDFRKQCTYVPVINDSIEYYFHSLQSEY